MSKNRYVNTRFWDDAYISGLCPMDKLLFLYLITNPLTNAAGIYEITIKRISFDTGIDQPRIKSSLEKFQVDGKVTFFPRSDWVILTNFIKNQSINPNMKAGIESLIPKFPVEVKLFLEQHLGNSLEGFESLSKACEGVHNLNLNLNLNLNSNSNSVPESERIGHAFSKSFEDFWKTYPNKVKKIKAFEKWKKIKPTPDLLNKILAAVAAQIKWRQEANGAFRAEWADPTTWLNGERWNDELSGNGNRASPFSTDPPKSITTGRKIKTCPMHGEYDARKINTCPKCAGIT